MTVLVRFGNKGIGESVWLGFFLYNILDRFDKICVSCGKLEYVEKYEKIKQNLKQALNTNAWDGKWYKRAFTDNKEVLGSFKNEECKIDSIAQSWSVISEAGDDEKKHMAMQSVEEYLVDKKNKIIKLLTPPFDKSSLEPGYIKSYRPGVRENGGQYTHECCPCGQLYIGIQPHAVRLHKLSVTHFIRTDNLILILENTYIIVNLYRIIIYNTN